MTVRVMTIVGTRPEIIKLCRVMVELEKHTEHILVHTGQNYDYELNELFFNQLGVRKPDCFLEAAGINAAQTAGNVIIKSDEALEKFRPDAILILGDTNSALSAYSAKRRKIPIFHMEAGNRCFDLRVPEEINRKIVDHISDINLPYTEHARRYLLAEGLKPDMVIKAGSPQKEVLMHYREQIDRSDIMKQLSLTEKMFFLVSAHREENVDNRERLGQLVDTLNKLAETYGFPVIVSTHPRTRKRLDELGAGHIDSRVQYMKAMGFFEYNHLQQKAFCVISDSGTITEESAILNFPAVTIRQAHERPEGMDEGIVIMCGMQADRLLDAVKSVTRMADEAKGARQFRIPADYDIDNLSKKIVRIILSYIDYVNRVVWSKA